MICRKRSVSYPLSACTRAPAGSRASRRGFPPRQSEALPLVRWRHRGRPSWSVRAWIFVVRPSRDRPLAQRCARTAELAIIPSDDDPPASASAVKMPVQIPFAAHRTKHGCRASSAVRRCLPAAAGLQNVTDAANHPPIIDTRLAPCVPRQQGHKALKLFIRKPKIRLRHGKLPSKKLAAHRARIGEAVYGG